LVVNERQFTENGVSTKVCHYSIADLNAHLPSSPRRAKNVSLLLEVGKLLFQLEQRAEVGLPPKSKLFSVVIDEYVRFRERDHRQGRTSAGRLRQIIRVAKFWREYAGGTPIEAIDDKVMREFTRRAAGEGVR